MGLDYFGKVRLALMIRMVIDVQRLTLAWEIVGKSMVKKLLLVLIHFMIMNLVLSISVLVLAVSISVQTLS